MSQKLHSVEDVAKLLGLHVRTVRNYVREGRLKAVRIGKQYRIAAEDLEMLTGAPTTPESRHVEVSSIVGIDGISPDDASRISNGMLAAAKNHPADDDPLRVDTIYDIHRARLKVIVTGSIASTTILLRLVAVYLER
jgi:excisionase family DNA binding protein